VIDVKEFQRALGLKQNLFAERMFALFDKDSDGRISFEEFVRGLSVFCPRGTVKEKIQFSFQIYDSDHDGVITPKELRDVLSASLAEHPQLVLSATQITSLIDATFREADSNADGVISYEEYEQMVLNHPAILEHMTVTVNVGDGPK
jgi:serine/threonine-protein phosphatase 2B regulatory subunit